MQRSRFVNVWRGVFVLALLLATTSTTSAQSITDARRVEFTPSPDHNATDPATGVAIVQSYSLQVFLAGGTTPQQAVSLGKPAPQSDGMIRVDFVALLTTPLTAGLIYETIVSAVGPGGSTASARSNTFAFTAPCTPSISPTSQAVLAGGGTGSSTVSAGTGCVWSAVSNATWITVNSGAGGTGPGTTTFTVAANAATTSRTGTLTIAGLSFTVNQAGTPCTPAISPTSTNRTAAAGSGTVAVTAPTGCGWTATSNANWITISAGATGSGNGSVTYNVTANPTTTARTGTLTVGGNTFTVTQAGAPCAPTIAPVSANLGFAASTNTVAVTSPTGCAWTATESAAWITISAGATGSGNGSVSYSVTANPTTTARSATITIGGNAFTVTQAGAPCAPTIAAASASVPAAGITGGTVSVTAATGCAWTATSNAAWITIAAATGSGSGSVTYDVAANTTTAPRTGTLTVGGNTFTVTQAGLPCNATLAAPSASATSVGGNGTVAVTAPTGCAWTSTSNAAWITISAGATGSGDGSVTYNVTPNPTTTARTGTLTIGGNTFTVTQAGAPCAPTVAPASANVGFAASTNAVAVTAATGCAWTAASNAPWITISAGAAGSGNGSVSYSVTANPTTAARSATITIGGNAFTVTQAGAPCAPTIAAASASVPAAGITGGTVSVTAATGCAWTATSNVAWMSITAGAAGSGNGSVTYNVAANTTTAPRTGILTVGGNTFTVTQAGVPCTATLAAPSASATSVGGSGTVAVTAPASCGWTSTSNAAWITISAGATGSGDGSVTYNVTPNPTTTPRTGTLTIGGNTFTVNQAGAPCAPTLVPASANVGASAISATVTVTAATGCAWTATESATWIAISAGATGSGNGSVTYDVTANPTTTARSATLTIGGNAFTVTQAGAPCAPAISAPSASVPAAGTTGGSVTVTSATGCAWTATSNAAWITITAAAGSGNGSVSYDVEANTAMSPRTGTLTIGGNTFTVTQAGVPCTATIAAPSASVTSVAGSGTVAVTAPTGCEWTATSNAAWITISAGATGSGNGSVTYNVTANPTTTARTGTLTVGGNTFTVSQAGAPCAPTIAPVSANLGFAASTNTVAVTSPTGCAWTATESAAWITISAGATGSGNGSVTYDVTANPTTTARSATLTIGGVAFTVTQAGAPCAPTLSAASASVVAAGITGGTVSVTAATGCAWDAASNDAWITLSAGAAGNGNGTVTYTVAANTASASRTGSLTIGGQTFTVTQAGVPCNSTISPASATVGAAASTNLVMVTASGCSWTAVSNDAWLTITLGAAGSGSGSVTYAAAANTSSALRTGSLTIGGDTFTVTQAGAPCAPSISPTTASIAAAGGSGTLTVTAPSGCNWTTTTSATWISVSSGATGSGNGSVTYVVTANTGGSRTGSVTIGGRTLTITQAAAACSYSISPVSHALKASGGTGIVTITTAAGCPWSASSPASWVTISNGTNRTGFGTVGFTAAANTTSVARTVTLTIAEQSFIVTEPSATCSFSVTPLLVSVAAGGGSGSITVTTSSTCAWTSSSSAAWVTLTRSSGTGSGTATYTFPANPGTTTRSAVVSIAGVQVTVLQGGTTMTTLAPPSNLRIQ